MTFAELVNDQNLKRPLTVHERAFLMAVEKAGFSIKLDMGDWYGDHFLIEKNPDYLTCELARVEIETLRMTHCWSDVLWETLPRLIAETRWPKGEECIAALERAGLDVGRERKADLVSIDRGPARVWLDVGDTVGMLGDPSDVDDELFLDVIEILDGPQARARHKAAIIEEDL